MTEVTRVTSGAIVASRSISDESALERASGYALSEEARQYAQASRSDATLRAYESDWNAWVHWATLHDTPPMPANPSAVASYISELPNKLSERTGRRMSVSSIARRVTAINTMHSLAGQVKPGDSKMVTEVLKGVRNTHGARKKQAAAVVLDDLRKMLHHIDLTTFPGGVVGMRDYSLLLLGWVGAYRRSEIAGWTTDIVRWAPDGLHVQLTKSKTRQDGSDEVMKFFPRSANPATCGPCWYSRWMWTYDVLRQPGTAREKRVATMRYIIASDDFNQHVCTSANPLPAWADQDAAPVPVFPRMSRWGVLVEPTASIGGQAVQEALVSRMADAELKVTHVTGHSLRAGYITQALRAKQTHQSIMNQTGQRSINTVVAYERRETPGENNSVTALGL